MNSIIPADMAAIGALLTDRRAERPSWRGHPMLSYWLFVYAVMVELLPQEIDDVVLTPLLFAAAIIFNPSVYANSELHFTLPKNILLKPVSSIHMALAVFFSMCTLRCRPLIAAYASCAAFYALTSGKGYHSFFVVPLLVAFPMLIGASLTLPGMLWMRAVSVAVLAFAYVLWVTQHCPIWMNTHVWNAVCFSGALVVGAGLSVVGVSQMRRGAGKSGRRINAEQPRSAFRRAYQGKCSFAAAPFADAEEAEAWRQWRCAWCVMPLGFIGMALFGVANMGYHAYAARFFNSANGGNGVGVEPFILPGMIVVGMAVGPALSGWLAATTVRSMGSLATRTLSVQALARCMFRGAIWGIAPTALLALGVFGLFHESLLAGVRWGHGVDLLMLLVYGLLAMWAATWSSASVNYVVMAPVFYLCLPLSLVIEGLVASFAVLLLVGLLLAYVVRAFYLALRNGLVTTGACWTASAVATVLIAVPLFHCPAWLVGLSMPLRVGVIVSIVALATAPMASVPLLCKALLSGPEKEPLLGWNGYRCLGKRSG